MDWLRRNWPDLLIGIALVAVIAGIIAILITGGSFFTIGQQPQQPPPQVSTLAEHGDVGRAGGPCTTG